MKISAIILSHYKERERNLSVIVNDLRLGSVVPDEIIVAIDNPDILFDDPSVKIVRINQSTPVVLRFALGLITEADYLLFIDDDLTVLPNTLKEFKEYAQANPGAILGLEGATLGEDNQEPYTKGESINRGEEVRDVDIIIRTYFVPRTALATPLYLRAFHVSILPSNSIDDILLCLGNKYLLKQRNIVIPISQTSDMVELDSGGVGQCVTPTHYISRNITCGLLRSMYGRNT